MYKKRRELYTQSWALTQIFLLVLAIFAFAFILNNSTLVNADEDDKTDKVDLGGGATLLLKQAIPRAKAVANVPAVAGATRQYFSFGNAKAIELGGSRGTIDLAKISEINRLPESAGGGAKIIVDGVEKTLTKEQFDKLTVTVNANGGSLKDFVTYKGSITGLEGFLGSLAEGAVWAGIAYGMGQMIGSFFGFNKKQSNTLGRALATGAFTWQVSQGIAPNTITATGGFFIGAGIAAIVFIATYKKEKEKTITFTCGAFEPPIGGAKCEECNKDKFRPCSEYRCKALGQACQLLNKEAPGKELCTWVNRGDSTSPTITPSVNALSPSGLSYISDTSTRPPALGVKITRNSAGNGCLNAFTPLQFGINTNEPAQCKIDWNITSDFDSMQYYFGESYSSYNHTLKMRLPGPADFNNPEDISPIFKNDGTSQLFVRCRDANGNYNVDAYSIKFCVDKSPDTTPPSIEGTSIASGNPVKFGTQTANVEVYVNEPAECKWSVESKSYADMENKMSCATLPEARNAIMTWVCNTNLTGIKNNADNKYYLRCKDQPGVEESKRNVMVQSYEYVLKGSQELNIISVSPNSTVTGGTSSVNVELELETANGAEEGKAFCFFSPLGTNDSYVQMFETNNFKHKQTLQLTNGDYKYYFRCTDLGGNSAEAQTSFKVFSDTLPPKVARIYKEEGVGLKIVTDEDAECVYSLTGCNFKFDDGLKAIYSNSNIKTNSYVEWKPNIIYYIKCRDSYGNEPNPGECSAAVRAVEG